LGRDNKTTVQNIIEKLTGNSSSILSEKVFNIAAESGLGDLIVKDCIKQLVEENFVAEPVRGVLRKCN
jgi:hypothetical protein